MGMSARRVLALLLFVVIASLARSQSADYDKYPFINADIDTISYDTVALRSFFIKMKELKEGKRKNVVIVHIGDSHLQADFFTSFIREHLQQDYGNGGRGLIFPYHVAGSNEPNNYRSTGTGEWKGRRCVMINPSYIPVGVAGFGLRTDDSTSSLKVNIKSTENLDYSFNKMTLLHDKGRGCYDWVVYTSNDFKDSVIIRDTGMHYGTAADTIVFKDTMSSFTMCTLQSDTGQYEAMIFGMVISNGKPGIIYHTIGSNGARYTDYNHSQFFIQQLAGLNPDLVIVSLGTNEVYSKRFNPDYFESDMDTMLTSIKHVAPETDILLTTPNDSFRGRRYKNADIADAVVTIKRVARKYHAAYWDFYHIMGGYGSMQKWYVKHLCQKDHVHFTGGGYTIQAELFYDAFNKAIKDGLEKLAP
jgi:lysophospholipase L1-like esterase